MIGAQSAFEELKMFLEVDSLVDEIKKKLDSFYMVMVICAVHPKLHLVYILGENMISLPFCTALCFRSIVGFFFSIALFHAVF